VQTINQARYQAHYHRALGDIAGGYRAFVPPRRVSVSQGAAENLVISRPGKPTVKFGLTDTKYMQQPMDDLAARHFKAVCFVGPSQSSKTMSLGEGWVSHVVVNDPGDMLIVQMTESKAREYVYTNLDRSIQYSPNLKAMLGGRGKDDNTFDKRFKNGMWLKIAWPTVSNLSSTSYRYVFFTDYDRIPDNINHEGDGWSLGGARTKTFYSRGKLCIESSPGRPHIDPGWKPATPHEAPPCTGILGVYNNSTRNRWYWKCPDCREHFEASPGLGLFKLPQDDHLMSEIRSLSIGALTQQYSKVICPHCGSMLEQRVKSLLNQTGNWLRDGERLTADDEKVGEGLIAATSGYWLGGVAAAYEPWDGLVGKYFEALREYVLTGSEEKLQTNCNTQQSMPYMSRHLIESQSDRTNPLDRLEDLPRYYVPDNTRALLAAVDVQGGQNARFEVEIHAVAPHLERTVVDRYQIKLSKRPGMGEEFAPIDPASYAEDWDILTEKILRSTYKTSIEGKELRVSRMIVDTGGEDGVTDRAYNYWRRAKREGFASRVLLYKGDSAKKSDHVIRVSMLGGKNGKKGDVPVYVCNTDKLSDAFTTFLRRTTPGPGYVHFPKWLSPAYFDELNAEVRDENGVWRSIRKRNETHDLFRMITAAMMQMELDKIQDWSTVPLHLAPLEHNTMLVDAQDRRAMQANTRIATLADNKPYKAPQKRVRRRVGSSYV
jgi:phage terminase large subunit GpA-like protein